MEGEATPETRFNVGVWGVFSGLVGFGFIRVVFGVYQRLVEFLGICLGLLGYLGVCRVLGLGVPWVSGLGVKNFLTDF